MWHYVARSAALARPGSAGPGAPRAACLLPELLPSACSGSEPGSRAAGLAQVPLKLSGRS